jgi:outer membrane protein insertion porin family
MTPYFHRVVGIQKGDIYNVELLNKKLGKQMSAEGGDIGQLYQDDGYLFFRADAVETSVYNDTIDYEIRLVEGPQARIGTVGIFGNEKTKDYVIRRELRTYPGELFSRTDLIRSQRNWLVFSISTRKKSIPILFRTRKMAQLISTGTSRKNRLTNWNFRLVGVAVLV